MRDCEDPSAEQLRVQASKRPKKIRRFRLRTCVSVAILGILSIATITMVLIHQFIFVVDTNELQNYRLPQSIRPLLYDLELFPNFYLSASSVSLSFNGSVRILLQCNAKTDRIFIHAVGLNFSDVSISKINDTARLSMLSDTSLRQFESHLLKFSRNLEADSLYSLHISFNGIFSSVSSIGMFYRDYEQANGAISQLVATHLQPTYARRVFPCFDEPGMKARFALRLVRRVDYYSLSNTPISRTETRGDAWEVDIFETTPPMSTYLLAFVIANLANQNVTDSTGRLYRAFAPTSELARLTYALNITPVILQYFEQWLNCSYAINKLDVVSMPRTRLEAMENWGLIIFQDRVILNDPAANSLEDKVYLEVVVAHELAHQWFGNLVTLGWWDDLWLNEGVATYLAFVGLEALHKDPREIDELYVSMYVHSALKKNGDTGANSMDRAVRTPQEITENFSPVHYGKAASLIRMMRRILSPATFQRALALYLGRFRYSNAHRSEFLKVLGDQWRTERPHDGLDIESVLHRWISNSGYPVLTVSKTVSAATNSCFVELSQSRFTNDAMSTAHDASSLWDIPFTIASSVSLLAKNSSYVEQLPFSWLRHRHERRRCNEEEARQGVWLIANLQQVGFYRTNYDVENWRMLISQLLHDHSKLSSITRAQLIDDAFSFAHAKILSFDVPLNLSTYLINEQHYTPWIAAFTHFDFIESLIPTNNSCSSLLRTYLTRLVETVYNRLWRNDSMDGILNRMLRIEVTRRACALGLPDCVTQARRQYDIENASASLQPDEGGNLLCTPDSWDAWYAFFQSLKQSNFPPQRLPTLRRFMQCTRDFKLMRRFLRLVKESSSEDTRSGYLVQDGHQLGGNGKMTASAYLKRMFDVSPTSLIQVIFSSYVHDSRSEAEIGDLRPLFGKKHFDQYLSSARSRLQSSQPLVRAVCEWLSKNTRR